MPSDLQVSNIKDLTGSNPGLSIASDGQVTISQNNPTVTLGSNTTFGSGVSLSNATFPSGHVLKTQMFDSSASITQESSGSWTPSALTSGSFSHGSGNKILIIAVCFMATTNEGWFVRVGGATSGVELEYYNSSSNSQLDTTTYAFLDSPSGTSTTYTVEFRRNSSGTATFYNVSSKLILMEVKG
tara:strand:- start:44 stop:598 length:555 start_codon:yes stop_codon:yes gene_type:complete